LNNEHIEPFSFYTSDGLCVYVILTIKHKLYYWDNWNWTTKTW